MKSLKELLQEARYKEVRSYQVGGPDDPEVKRKAKAATRALAKKVAREREKREAIDLREIARWIEDAFGNAFPDGDPIDGLAERFKKRGLSTYNMIEILDRAAKAHLGSKNYNDYLATVWHDQVADNGEIWGLTVDQNPWKSH